MRIWRQSLLLAGILVLLTSAGRPPHADAATIASVMSSISTSTTQRQTGRLIRDGVTSDCATQKFVPGINDSTTRGYLNHTFRSSLTNPVCVTISFSTACTIFSVAYRGTFNPANIQENYAADMGWSTDVTTSYSLPIPAGAFFSVVVHEMTANAGCATYTLTLTSNAPWATSTPAIAGAGAVGAELAGTDAVWKTTPSAPTVERRWVRCDTSGGSCADIPAATGASYTPTDADLGHALRFRNVATDTDGTSTSDSDYIEPFIPFETHTSESLAPGDGTHSGLFVRDSIESRCAQPKSLPAILLPGSTFFYDAYPVTSLLNEPVCMVARTDPGCGGHGVTLELYDPVFVPGSGLATNYAANSGRGFDAPSIASLTLAPGESREAVVSRGNFGGTCNPYAITLGADAPFATVRPSMTGDAARGEMLTAADGVWSGTPVISRSWLRCDGEGGACVSIMGAGDATYTPIAADVGKRLRLRVTATQGRSASSDSEPSPVVASIPDRTGPKGSLRLASRNLRRAVRSRRIPVRLTSDELCSAVVQVQIGKRLAKRLGLKRTRIARVAGAVPVGRAVVLRAKLTRASRRALARRRSLRVRIAAVLTDAAGNRAPLTKSGSLKRPRR